MFALRERRRRSKRWQGIRVRAPGCGRGHPCSCNTHSPRLRLLSQCSQPQQEALLFVDTVVVGQRSDNSQGVGRKFLGPG
jgi:hypothetical protein